MAVKFGDFLYLSKEQVLHRGKLFGKRTKCGRDVYTLHPIALENGWKQCKVCFPPQEGSADA